MITTDHPLIQLLALIDMVWVARETVGLKRGAPQKYSEKTVFKVYLVSVLKKLWARRSLWRYLSSVPLVATACGLESMPDRRTLDRRLSEIAGQAEAQIQALGLALSVEAVTDATVAASDGSAFATPGPVWHKKDKAAGVIPKGLHGLDREADWIQSTYHGWVYGYKAHVTVSVAPTTVRVVLGATVTGSAGESHVLRERLAALPPLVETLLLDAGDDDGQLIDACTKRGIEVLVPLAKTAASGRPIWPPPKGKVAIGNAARASNLSLRPSKTFFNLTRCPFKASGLPQPLFSWHATPGT